MDEDDLDAVDVDGDTSIDGVADLDDDATADDADDDPDSTGDVIAEAASKKKATKPGDDDSMDLDEDHHPDDVEEPLDVVLRERTATPEDSDDDLDEETSGSDGNRRITPRGSDEFLCSSCFLVLPRNQLADEKQQLCRDCV